MVHNVDLHVNVYINIKGVLCFLFQSINIFLIDSDSTTSFGFGIVQVQLFLDHQTEATNYNMSLNHKEEFISNMIRMLSGGTSNDVKIVLEDGEIFANKDVLSSQSDYFATMLNNRNVKFIEGETNIVNLNYCSKKIMEKIIKFLFTGEMSLLEMSVSDLVSMVNISRMMLLFALKDDIQKHLLKIIVGSGTDLDVFPELVKSLIIAENLNLDTIKTLLVRELYKCICLGVDYVVDSNCELAIKQIPFKLLKEIMLFGETKESENIDEDPQITFNRFDVFVLWLSVNECTDEDKKEMTDSFKFEDFDEYQLITVVMKSNLYSTPKVNRRVLDLFTNLEKTIVEQENCLSNKSDEINNYSTKVIIQEKKIEEMTEEINILRNNIVIQDKKILKLNREIRILTNKGKIWPLFN